MAAQNALNLRSHTLVELLDQALRLYRNNFLKFVGIVAIALIPVQIIELLLNLFSYSGNLTDPNAALSASVRVFAFTLLSLVLTIIFVNGVATAALTSAITSSYLGEKITIGGAYTKIRKSWGRLLGALLLLMVITIIIFIWTIIPCAGWFTGLGILTMVGLAVSPLIAPVIVVENISGMKAIRRAWDLVRRRFWWVLGYFVLILLFNLLVIQGPVQLLAALFQRTITSTIASTQLVSTVFLQLIINAILTLLLSLIYIPLQATCATLAYFDLRIRQEGFDLAMMANQTTESPINAVDLAGQTTGPSDGPLFTWKEMGYFVLISIGFAVCYAVLIFGVVGLSRAF